MLPQFDVSSFSSQLFWLVIVFGRLYLIVSKFIAPKAESILISRNRFLEGNINEAEAHNQKASELRAEIETKLGEVNSAIEEMHKKAAKDLDSTYEHHKRELALEIENKAGLSLKEVQKMAVTFQKQQVRPAIGLASYIIEKITDKPADMDLLQKIQERKS